MYATTINEALINLINKVIEEGRRVVACRTKAAKLEDDKDSRDPVVTYENLFCDSDARKLGSPQQLAAQANDVLQLTTEAKVELERAHEDASWQFCDFYEAMRELIEAVGNQEVKDDLKSCLGYICDPDYETEPDYRQSNEYRIEQVVAMLETLRTPEGCAHRDRLLKRAVEMGIEYPQGKTNARLYHMIEQREYTQMQRG